MSTILSLPNHWNPSHAADYTYSPDQLAVANAAANYRDQFGLTAAASDSFKLHLLLIDVQKDFCFPQGSLYVGGRTGTGAIDDNRRIAEFIYHNLEVITQITTTLDTHFAYQIFFPWFWQYEDGTQPPPHTVVTASDISTGHLTPNPAVAGLLVNGNYQWLLKQVEFYCQQLEAAGKYQLYLWPPHCLLGSDGHALAGVIHEARLFHSFARFAQSLSEIKGSNPLTENYSVLRPEVLERWDHQRALAQKNTNFLETLLKADALVIAGQASSHCVKSSIDDILEEVMTRDPGLAAKIYILSDGMSSVTVPDGNGGFIADFTDQAEAALKRFQSAGMHVVDTQTPIGDWPDIGL